jgi:hypothetical protein
MCTVREIYVASGGSLKMGSPTCRLYSTIDITFYGSKADSAAENTYTGNYDMIYNDIYDLDVPLLRSTCMLHQ